MSTIPDETRAKLRNLRDDIAVRVCRSVAELPDRDSPKGWPEAMLVTHEELHAIVLGALNDVVEGVRGRA